MVNTSYEVWTLKATKWLILMPDSYSLKAIAHISPPTQRTQKLEHNILWRQSTELFRHNAILSSPTTHYKK